MNSFMFNILLVMLCSISVTQFCAGAFEDYTNFTDISIIFVTQIKYLRGLRYFFEYKIFEYALCAVIFISTVWLSFRPSDVAIVKNMVIIYINYHFIRSIMSIKMILKMD